MSDCEETLRELETFLDDELDAPARAAIQSHLEGCTDCFQAFDDQTVTTSWCKAPTHSRRSTPGH